MKFVLNVICWLDFSAYFLLLGRWPPFLSLNINQHVKLQLSAKLKKLYEAVLEPPWMFENCRFYMCFYMCSDSIEYLE